MQIERIGNDVGLLPEFRKIDGQRSQEIPFKRYDGFRSGFERDCVGMDITRITHFSSSRGRFQAACPALYPREYYAALTAGKSVREQ